METNDLFHIAGDAVGFKQLSHALGLSLAHTYKLAADPMSLDVPVRNDLDRIASVVDMMAARPHAKPALVLWRTWFQDLFARAIYDERAPVLTCDNVQATTERLCSEFADVLKECRKDFVPEAVAKQAAELMAVLETLVRCAGVKTEQRKTVPLRAS